MTDNRLSPESPSSGHLSPEPPSPGNSRIVSIDALRGFTMVFIIGGSGFLSTFHKVWPNPWTKMLADHMKHAGWEGFCFLDLIAPLFLFLVGLLLPTVVLGRIEKGMRPSNLYPHLSRNPCSRRRPKAITRIPLPPALPLPSALPMDGLGAFLQSSVNRGMGRNLNAPVSEAVCGRVAV